MILITNFLFCIMYIPEENFESEFYSGSGIDINEARNYSTFSIIMMSVIGFALFMFIVFVIYIIYAECKNKRKCK